MTTQREIERKVYQCDKCQNDAVCCWRPDLDLRGLCACEEHKEDVQIAYLLLISGNSEAAKTLIKSKNLLDDTK